MRLFIKLFIVVKRSTCFGQSFRPSSGAQNCTYGNRHMSDSCRYLPPKNVERFTTIINLSNRCILLVLL